MKGLLLNLNRTDLVHARNMILLDTCFVISLMEQRESLAHLARFDNIAITSFNLEELMHVEHKLDHDTRRRLRSFLKDGNFIVLDMDVHPGDRQAERDFVSSVDRELLKVIHDPSDAILLAAAIKTRSTVLTKDKHHLFTVQLENFLRTYALKVYKDVKSLNNS